jgi:hypothetical protein
VDDYQLQLLLYSILVFFIFGVLESPPVWFMIRTTLVKNLKNLCRKRVYTCFLYKVMDKIWKSQKLLDIKGAVDKDSLKFELSQIIDKDLKILKTPWYYSKYCSR